MPGQRESAHESQVQLGPVDAPASVQRRMQTALGKTASESIRANTAIARELRSLQTEYRKELAKLVGAPAMRDLNALRASRSELTRSQRTRRSRAVLEDAGVDPAEVAAVRRRYLDAARDLLARASETFPYRTPSDRLCDGPWVTYTAPFGGWVWSFNWQRTANPADPTLTRYLDVTTGRIGSRIRTKVSGAGDDDRLVAEYYTGLNVWHTPSKTGPLEVYVAFEFATSAYSGKVTDETGFSDVTYSQFARARMLAADAQVPVQQEAQETLVYNLIDFVWGEDLSWSKQVFEPRDIHWYHFKTAATFQQDSLVLLEGGIRHMTWFETNDQSVSTAADLDLRLDRIMVRSCEAELIL